VRFTAQETRVVLECEGQFQGHTRWEQMLKAYPHVFHVSRKAADLCNKARNERERMAKVQQLGGE
jgi:hypothetical protein